jgi:release factor glutamine methyltransferase
MRTDYLIYNYLFKPILKVYLRFDVNAKIDGFRLKILSGVFHPLLFFSTKFLYSFLKKQPLKNLQFLEIGSGSGLLSLLAYREGAIVTAIDIDPKAIENTLLNFSRNFQAPISASILQSNLFEELPLQLFDIIVINPPYFFKKINTNKQLAWNTGENGEYFERLFANISKYMHGSTMVFMVLADNCDIDRITLIASHYKIYFNLVEEEKIKWEKNYIYKLSAHGNTHR